MGFVVGGAGASGNKSLLLRGMGPSLGALGVAEALADPRLALFHDTTELAVNDNWGGDATVAALSARLGAFAFSGPTSKDAALAALPDTDGYTVQIASADGSQARLVAELDNLGKGASGAAVQSLNLISGLPETAGLVL